MTRKISRAAIMLAALLPQAGRVAAAQQTLPDAPRADAPGKAASGLRLKDGLPQPACHPDSSTATNCLICCDPEANPFRKFLANDQASHPMTPRQKLILAGRNTVDPFNVLTILGTSAIATASGPDSVYGPGLKGFARNSAVVFTEGVTSEFFGTFLIPSLAHQDPHFHRMPNASMGRRVGHAFYQVVWTQSDTGKPMFNYATVLGTVADDAVNGLYVPGRELGAGSSAARIGIAIATDPIDNLITEFVPDVARRVKFHVVFVQRIINRVALEEGRNASP